MTDTLPLPETAVTLLLVSAHPSDRVSLQRILAHSGWKLQVRSSCREGLALLRRGSIPVVICDAEDHDGNWRALLDETADIEAPPKVIVCSRLADERLWAEVLNLGGYDVLSTPFAAGEVLRACFLAWQNWRQVSPRPILQSAVSY